MLRPLHLSTALSAALVCAPLAFAQDQTETPAPVQQVQTETVEPQVTQPPQSDQPAQAEQPAQSNQPAQVEQPTQVEQPAAQVAPAQPQPQAPPDLSASSRDAACAFAKSAGEGVDALVTEFERQADLFDPTVRASIAAQTKAQLAQFRLARAAAYLTYEVPDHLRAYLLAVRTDSRTIWLDLRYEGFGSRVVLTSFRYNTDVEKALVQPHSGQAQAVDCPN